MTQAWRFSLAQKRTECRIPLRQQATKDERNTYPPLYIPGSGKGVAFRGFFQEKSSMQQLGDARCIEDKTPRLFTAKIYHKFQRQK